MGGRKKSKPRVSSDKRVNTTKPPRYLKWKKVHQEVYYHKKHIDREDGSVESAFWPALFAFLSPTLVFFMLNIALFGLSRSRLDRYNRAQAIALFGFFGVLFVFAVIVNIFASMVTTSSYTELMAVFSGSINFTLWKMLFCYVGISLYLVGDIIIKKRRVLKYPVVTQLVDRVFHIRE